MARNVAVIVDYEEWQQYSLSCPHLTELLARPFSGLSLGPRHLGGGADKGETLPFFATTERPDTNATDRGTAHGVGRERERNETGHDEEMGNGNHDTD